MVYDWAQYDYVESALKNVFATVFFTCTLQYRECVLCVLCIRCTTARFYSAQGMHGAVLGALLVHTALHAHPSV